MGRHSLPDSHAAEGRRDHPRPGRSRRTVVIATLLVLSVATGTAVAAKGGLWSFSESCEDSAVHLSVVASPDIAPAVRSVAERARADEVRADGRCLEVEVLARDAHKVVSALAAGDAEPDFQVWLPDSELWLERAKGLGEGIPVSPVGLGGLLTGGRGHGAVRLAGARLAPHDVHLGRTGGRDARFGPGAPRVGGPGAQRDRAAGPLPASAPRPHARAGTATPGWRRPRRCSPSGCRTGTPRCWRRWRAATPGPSRATRSATMRS